MLELKFGVEEPYISRKRDDEYNNTVSVTEKRYKLQRLERTNELCYNLYRKKKSQINNQHKNNQRCWIKIQNLKANGASISYK